MSSGSKGYRSKWSLEASEMDEPITASHIHDNALGAQHSHAFAHVHYTIQFVNSAIDPS